MAKTLEEKDFDKYCPKEPLSHEVVDRAWRAEMKLRQAIGEAKSLLKARSGGSPVEVNGCVLPLSVNERRQVFGLVWGALLKSLTYWEWHARRYQVLSKAVTQELMSVRTQIDEYQNG